ncbi:acyltransferase family protein [Salmonella enterica]|nr:acyltransferase [Salmonella enterica subsp. VII str. CFSAN000550]EDU6368614.1 acyltransferase [Salmonella enterica subsp. houtenae serovar 40:z4,z24:-]EDU7900251.1 acyltransferase [Salmonella enterica subsp. houtenae]EEO7409199.1 acyltransferase [Salmonella enterica]QJY68773.1 acyltransferase [Salmonella enterica subsp. VII serovar 1,40:g,z51:--]
MFALSETQKTTSRYYQPDVDGLRTVAVLLVLFFHAGFTSLSGGFIGVDIFFVISGYLITGILVSSVEKKKFNYITFMLSRVSRLYPTLLAIILLTLVCGFLIYTPGDFKELGVTSVYSALSASNFHFMLGAGYFDTSSEINPLLHTWSLAVEQQFYLVWPIVIWLSMKASRKLAIAMIAASGIASLIASQYMSHTDPTQNYFMVQYRIFEFAAGGLLFFIPNSKCLNKLLSTLMFIIGISLIVYAAFHFDKNTAFPGINAMLPVIGACLCIIYSKHTPAGYLLRNKIFVSIGLVSYSVYLIHWPLLVFYKYYIFRPLYTFEKISIAIMSLVLAYVSYALIENKFRRINLSGINVMSASFVVMLALIVLSSTMIYRHDGFSFRVNEYFKEKMNDAGAFHLQQYGGNGYYAGAHIIGDKTETKVSAVIMGDSFARQYAHAIDVDSKGYKFITSMNDGCFFSRNYTTFYAGLPDPKCQQRLNFAINYSNKFNVPVIFGLRWIGYEGMISDPKGNQYKFKDENEFIKFSISNIKNNIAAFNGKKVVILGAPPGTDGVGGVEKCVNRPSYLPLVCTKYLDTDDKDTFNKRMNLAIQNALKEDSNVMFIDPYKYLCKNGKCMTMTSDHQFVYSDAVHLSKSGAKVMWDQIKDDVIKFIE